MSWLARQMRQFAFDLLYIYGGITFFIYRRIAKARWWWQVHRPIPKDEFHRCLEHDLAIMFFLTPEENSRYAWEIQARRGTAHERDLRSQS